jgi:hypothetical protein
MLRLRAGGQSLPGRFGVRVGLVIRDIQISNTELAGWLHRMTSRYVGRAPRKPARKFRSGFRSAAIAVRSRYQFPHHPQTDPQGHRTDRRVRPGGDAPSCDSRCPNRL